MMWYYKSGLGIVHKTGCRICQKYTNHVLRAEDDDEGAFLEAKEEWIDDMNNHFREGFRRGRQIQRHHNNNRLEDYLAQAESVYRDDLMHAREEIAVLKECLREIGLRIRTHGFFGDLKPFFEQYFEGELEEHLYESELSDSFSEPEENDIEENEIEESDDVEDDPYSEISDEPVLHCFAMSLEPNIGLHEAESLNPHESLASWTEYDDIHSIKSLILRAHQPGSDKEIKLIRSLRSQAYRIARPSRTNAQRYLLKTWMRPSILFPSYVVDPSEVYVDASGTGIGFVMGNKWEAWGLKEGWSADGRDILWAETVAVELGLRMLITAGYKDRVVVMRSDNKAVISAFKKGFFKRSCNTAVLERIRYVSEIYRIDLCLEWVPTSRNVADGPSRGRFGIPEDLFEPSVIIPPYLTSFVEPRHV